MRKGPITMAEITAHIAGTIFKIEKQAGEAVSEGEEVIILESMKMEIPLESPINGVIKEILVAEGDPVDENMVVAIVE
jgi:acetyl-CoA carboxylase biotin carboxyl carrier protein